MVFDQCDIIIKSENLCAVRRSVVYELWRNGECGEIGVNMQSAARSVGIHLNVDANQIECFKSVARTIWLRLPKGRKRKPYLDQFYEWEVLEAKLIQDCGSAEIVNLKKQLEEVAKERDEARAETVKVTSQLEEVAKERDEVRAEAAKITSQLEEVAKERDEVRAETVKVTSQLEEVAKERDEVRAETAKAASRLLEVSQENCKLKTNIESLKHRSRKYKSSRDTTSRPYSKSHKNRMKNQLKETAERYGLNTETPVPSASPEQASVLIDRTNISLRQYKEIAKVIPQTPKLHKLKKERRRYVLFSLYCRLLFHAPLSLKRKNGALFSLKFREMFTYCFSDVILLH